MLRFIPTPLTTHPCLTPKQRAYFGELDKQEEGKYTLQAIGQLLEALIRQQVPGWQNYYPTDWLGPGRALSAALLDEDQGFTSDEVAQGHRTLAATVRPEKLLAFFFGLRKLRRTRQLARLYARHHVIPAAQLPVGR